MKILVFGISGLIGHTVYRYLKNNTEYEVIGTLRTERSKLYEDNKGIKYGIDAMDFGAVKALIDNIKPSQIINCVGITKHVPVQSDNVKLIQLNATFPHLLSKIASHTDARVIHISTDCVFSGSTGDYTEYSITDASDMYGKSKALGEINDDKNLTIRTSTIGHELNTRHGLLEWFLAQNKSCFGYRRAVFSGVPTVRLAKILAFNVIPDSDLTGLYNLSADPINKFDLLNKIKKQYRKDIDIIPSDELEIDRSLNSEKFKTRAGIDMPDWDELISEMYNLRQL